MKRSLNFYTIFFINLLLSCLPIVVSGQCPFGSLFITNQFDLDLFGTEYPDCTEINGDVSLTTFGPNPIDDISDLTPLSKVVKINGNLRINGTLITSFRGLTNLDSINGNFEIIGNDLLESFDSLISLSSIKGSLYVSNNDAITSFSGLENITRLLRGFTILRNDGLQTLKGLENITSFDSGFSDLIIVENTNLESLEYFPAVDSVRGWLDIESSPKIKDVLPLSNLKRIRGVLKLSNLNNLENLSGFDSLTNLGAGLAINNCPLLEDLQGLENVEYIGFAFLVDNNPQITTLNDIGDFTTASADGMLQDFFIRNNPNLSVCDIPPVCRYLASGGEGPIENNKDECIDKAAVTNACLVPTSDISLEDLRIYPNPADQYLDIKFSAELNIHELALVDVSGRRVLEKANLISPMRLSTTHLKAGIYFLQLRDKDGYLLTTQKLTILR